MAVGYVSYINIINNYGFIDSPELQLDQIFFHSTNCNKSYKHIYKGDKVNFDLNANEEKGSEAINISFIENASLDGLRKDFENNALLKGFLKKIEKKYFVKDKDTHIFIPLSIAGYEKNIKEVYEDNLNKLIDYKIITLSGKNKIRAININRQFVTESKLLIEGSKIDGIVVNKVKGGYRIKVLDTIFGFLPGSFAVKSQRILEPGEVINVTIINASDRLENVVFNLTENIDNDNNLIFEKEKFISSLKPGDKFSGKIVSVQGFGIFISNGLCEGLLHMNNILNESANIPKESKKEFSKLVERVFHKSQEIQVIVEQIINNRISFNWDKSLELNKKLYEDLSTKFKLLDMNK